MTNHFKRLEQTDKKTGVKINVGTGNGFLSNYNWGMAIQQRLQQIK